MYLEIRVVSSVLGVVTLAKEHIPEAEFLGLLLELFDHWDNCLPSSTVVG